MHHGYTSRRYFAFYLTFTQSEKTRQTWAGYLISAHGLVSTSTGLELCIWKHFSQQVYSISANGKNIQSVATGHNS